jgi:CYTH domain-containing protein
MEPSGRNRWQPDGRCEVMSERARKYARSEFERRFLMAELPASLSTDDGWLIVDRYLTGTRLRLRRMEPFGAGERLYRPEGRLKLTQKNVVAPPDFSRMTITNIFLSAEEYDLLAQRPAHELRKRRYRVEHDNGTFSVDAFEAHISGLILAELGFETARRAESSVPTTSLGDSRSLGRHPVHGRSPRRPRTRAG